ncbi:2-alkenal reductase [Chryseomicrobium excrementi]|uniref:2-alkenal reductase n=1 Tax=Chryseomicrobium excrementi TaxID=2041346 RepID=A0A2M9EY15_9BACL|nr:trypsin-like peptidase domain-containing protein [Chryseomicrobium excrementi]PJK16088.1 2-alkenal reductase [Chryseomicrobium excrementi]
MDDYKPYNPYAEEPQPPKRSEEPKKKRGIAGYFLAGLSGVLVGALLLWFMMPSLQSALPDSGTRSSSGNITSTEQVSTDVTSDVTAAVEKTSAAVVGITNLQEVNDFWSSQQGEQEAGTGSGVIYKVDGDRAFVVTNHHVVDGATSIEVTLQGGKKVNAELVGSDVWTDLAVLEMDSADVETVIEFGDSDALKQGEPVIAIGNPLGLDFFGSVTTGILSGKERVIPVDLNEDGQQDWQTEVLQTDAAINPGNSGGALINVAGQLIGINSMKISQTTVEGIGLAIPINSAIPIIEDLEQNGEVQRPSMGVTLIDVEQVPSFHQQETLKLPEDITTGVVVDDVIDNSPAAAAGMQQYDVIVELDGEKIENMLELRQHLYTEKEVGDSMNVKVYRQGEIVEFTLELTDNNSL